MTDELKRDSNFSSDEYDKLRKEIHDSITNIINKYDLSDGEIQKIYKNIENII